jgi:hypothetical protein
MSMVGSSASIVSYRFFAPVVCLVLIYVVVDHLGPQTKFPVPEGILNYQGQNFIAITLWAQQEEGAKLEGLELVADAVIQSGYQRPKLSWVDKFQGSDVWNYREAAY